MTNTKLPDWPKMPERLTAGRYGEMQWGYAEYVGSYDFIGRKYEYDRAEAATARLKQAVEVMKWPARELDGATEQGAADRRRGHPTHHQRLRGARR